jgi:hypothetical protein
MSEVTAWAYILLGGGLVVLGGISGSYGWHLLSQEKEIAKNDRPKIDDVKVEQKAEETLSNVKAVSIEGPRSGPHP